MHLIHHHSIEIKCNREVLGQEFKDDLNTILQLEFYPKLEKLLLNYDDTETIWSIDVLPIVLDNLNSKHWKTEFVDQSMLQIESFLKENFSANNKIGKEISTAKSGCRMNKKEHAQSLMINYLKTGRIETNVQTTTLEKLYDEIEINTSFVKRLKEHLKGQIKAILRWSLNMPQHLKFEFLGTDGITHDFDFAVKAIGRSPQLNDFLEFLYWMAYFNEESSMFDQRFMTIIKSIAKHYYSIDSAYVDTLLYQNDKDGNALIEPSMQSALSDEAPSSKAQVEIESLNHESSVYDKEQAIYIENAGLVLLHPFLPKLFSELDYQEKGLWKDVISQHRAVLVLQYLVGFDDAIFENQLLLNKLICGVNLIDIIHTKFQVTEQEKAICHDLLESVINHWKILKNTSVAGLQESFINRAGKLVLRENEPHELHVENKSFDVLLDQLPWGIEMIKTPWMKTNLTCNWR